MRTKCCQCESTLRLKIYKQSGVLRYLDHLGVEALSHLCPSVGQQHRAVSVDVNQSSGLQTEADRVY